MVRTRHMQRKDSFNHSILKLKKDGSLSANKQEFPMEKGKLQTPTDKIDECIKKIP